MSQIVFGTKMAKNLVPGFFFPELQGFRLNNQGEERRRENGRLPWLLCVLHSLRDLSPVGCMSKVNGCNGR
jgi:hypothetical protein